VIDFWRRTGAELPFGDLGADRGTPFEGWYWRLVDPAGGRVIVALCGGMRTWSLGAVALHPGGEVVQSLDAAHDEHGVRFPGGELRVELRAPHRFPRGLFGALGPANLLPWLPQYWQPLVLHARAHGEATIGGRTIAVDGWDAYHEKNWGPQFAGDWWWGQAHVEEGVCVAFAGGRVGPAAPTAVVAGGVAIAPPFLVRTHLGEGTWAVRARSLRHQITIEAEGRDPHVLPVPAGERRAEPRSHQVLAGRLSVTVQEGRRVKLRAESSLAGLERGFASAPRPGAPPA
jgi:hypothetical protein